ncbi:hypothetical protein KSU1_C0852 [Candidatus Jettenia caeni]|uniref:Uncharacterized protein n=1 Tax=Candidatus Jettenia caeni TaxID=247490 RepID=I3IL53_9BACT|nr:hypothetical protein KSU1_C0852 [Candidatus Jettenia caeni]
MLSNIFGMVCYYLILDYPNLQAFVFIGKKLMLSGERIMLRTFLYFKNFIDNY